MHYKELSVRKMLTHTGNGHKNPIPSLSFSKSHRKLTYDEHCSKPSLCYLREKVDRGSLGMPMLFV